MASGNRTVFQFVQYEQGLLDFRGFWTPEKRRRIRKKMEPDDLLISSCAHPFLKWAGGKQWLVKGYWEYFENAGRFRKYFEPFLGSGAIFFRLEPRLARLSDTNADLVNCYRAVRDGVEEMIENLRIHKARHMDDPKAYYYAQREIYNSGKSSLVERAALLIYLNKTCYNGLYRVNSRGEFNVPMGRYANPPILDEQNLRMVSIALQRAEIEVEPFEKILEYAQKRDFVYFDPPYDPLSDTAYFTSYTSESFGEEQQRLLAWVFHELADRGCRLILSNHRTPLVKKLYSGRGYVLKEIAANRCISSRTSGRKDGAVEYLIMANVHSL